VPDVVVVRESHDVSAHLAHPARCIVADICAHPRNFAAAHRFFIAASGQTWETAALLGVRPLYAGTASLTACVALAEQWGAARVVLVGVDLAFARDGSGYADGSAYEGYRGSVDADGVVELGGAGLAAMTAQAGTGALPARQATAECAAWGGVGTVRALETWVDQRRWLEAFARRVGSRDECDDIGVTCVDATEGGSRKEGWWEQKRSTLCWAWENDQLRWSGTTEEPWRDVDPARVAAALADIARQCDTAEAMPAGVIGDALVADAAGWLRGTDVIDAAAAGALLRVRDAALSPAENARAVARCMATAAAEMRAVLGEDA
jgi:hypothetical protein